MMTGRGIHHTDETEILPGPADTSTAPADTDDEKTPPIWWVKTIASYTLLAIAVALLAVLVVIPRLTGSTAYTVLTGSMQPTYPPGTLIVVKPTPGADLNAGDVITFQPESGNPSVTTHRIISIVYDAQGVRKFITKGDANNATDDVQLIEEQIRGRLLYSVPQLGRLNSLLSGATRSVMIFVIAAALGGYALWMWISGLRDRKNGKDGDSDEPPADGEPENPVPPVGTVDALTTAMPPQVVAAQDVVAQGAPAPPVCHACGAPQAGGHALAYSAVPEPPAPYYPPQQAPAQPFPAQQFPAQQHPPAPQYPPPLYDLPSEESTRPIPVVR